jgi:hypothetical protein
MLHFDPTREGKNGDYPSVATSTKNIVVCAYEGVFSHKMYFRVGDVQHDTIGWREEIPHGPGEYVRVGLFEKKVCVQTCELLLPN